MNRILDKAFEHTAHRIQVIPTITKMDVDYDCRKTGADRPFIDKTYEWCITLTLKQNFWANRAQYESAHKIALKAMAHELYQDVHAELHHLELAVVSGDRDAALKSISQIRKNISYD